MKLNCVWEGVSVLTPNSQGVDSAGYLLVFLNPRDIPLHPICDTGAESL